MEKSKLFIFFIIGLNIIGAINYIGALSCMDLPVDKCQHFMSDEIKNSIQEHINASNRICFDSSLTKKTQGNCISYLNCSCYWDSTNNKCIEQVSTVYESTDNNEDSCNAAQSDKYLCRTITSISGSCNADSNAEINEYTIIWTSTWSGSGQENSMCASGTKKIACPSINKKSVPFFGITEFSITIIVICFIYIIYLINNIKNKFK